MSNQVKKKKKKKKKNGASGTVCDGVDSGVESASDNSTWFLPGSGSCCYLGGRSKKTSERCNYYLSHTHTYTHCSGLWLFSNKNQIDEYC